MSELVLNAEYTNQYNDLCILRYANKNQVCVESKYYNDLRLLSRETFLANYNKVPEKIIHRIVVARIKNASTPPTGKWIIYDLNRNDQKLSLDYFRREMLVTFEQEIVWEENR